jgi:hypothetical protein
MNINGNLIKTDKQVFLPSARRIVGDKFQQLHLNATQI